MEIIMAIYNYYLMLQETAMRWLTESPVAYYLLGITGACAGYLIREFQLWLTTEIEEMKRRKETK